MILGDGVGVYHFLGQGDNATTKIGYLSSLLFADEGGVECEAADKLVLEGAAMLDAEVEVARKCQLLIDLDGHPLHDRAWSFLIVNLIGFQSQTLLVAPDEFEVVAVDYLEVGLALSGAAHIRDRVDDDLVRRFQNGSLDQSLVDLFKVLYVASL